MNSKCAIIVAMFVVGFMVHSASTDVSIPSWLKSNTKYWKQGPIGDDEYVMGIQFLIQMVWCRFPPFSLTSGHGVEISKTSCN